MSNFRTGVIVVDEERRKASRPKAGILKVAMYCHFVGCHPRRDGGAYLIERGGIAWCISHAA
jgi:hypothetical protein